ncbi:hypothetical protein [Oceaniradius stylonematis]|uniref:hypothetical protein n=1 Tax=Oceaniradius stylonematis TaxID=2184161 RepID=UPI003C7DBC79
MLTGRDLAIENGISRRRLVCGGGALLLTVGCSSASQSCNVGDTLAQAQCRQANIRSSAARNITAGVLIGAAVGAGFAIAFGLPPELVILGGALIGGGITAAERYFQYRVEQANYNQLAAVQDVRQDILQDIRYVNVALADLRLAYNEMAAAFEDTRRMFAEATLRATRAMELDREIKKNATTFQIAGEVYRSTARLPSFPRDAQVDDEIDTLKKHSSGLSALQQQHREKIMNEGFS